MQNSILVTLINAVMNRTDKEHVIIAIDGPSATGKSTFAKNTLELLVDNYKLASKNQIAICQDTGLACVFIEIGQEVYVEGSIEVAIN